MLYGLGHRRECTGPGIARLWDSGNLPPAGVFPCTRLNAAVKMAFRSEELPYFPGESSAHIVSDDVMGNTFLRFVRRFEQPQRREADSRAGQ